MRDVATSRFRARPHDRGRTGRRLRWSFRLFLGSFLALTLAVVTASALDPRPIDVVLLVLVVAAGGAAIAEQRAVGSMETGRRAEAESFTRILRGLARSVSPDAIVAAIVEELGTGTSADHVVVVRRRPESRILDATLHATRPGVPASTTVLPISDLDDAAGAPFAGGASDALDVPPDRPMAAIPIVPDGDPRAGRVGLTVLGGATVATGAAATAVAARSETRRVRTRERRPVRSQVSLSGDDPGRRVADRIARRVREVYGLRHTVSVPLVVGGRIEGAIVLSRRTAGPWPPAALRILDAAAIETSAALARVYSMRRAETRASTDALTGLPNRRYFDEVVGLFARRRRADDRLGLLMVDIDRFKRLNDTFGHAVGDHVLRAVAGAIAGAVREHDIPARVGGEEFAVLLRNPSPEIAVEVGERVRRSVAALDLRGIGVPAVSVSVGVAVARRSGGTVEDLIEEADRALYRAKRAGRDRVVAA